jgi:hypothetical protein
MVFGAVKMLNFFPVKGGVSETLSPNKILSGESLDYNKHLVLPFSKYVQVHEEYAPQNSQIACTKGAIALGPSDNLQGGHKFMALNTGKKIIRQSWTVIPISDVVIKRVNTMAADHPALLTFTNRSGNAIDDGEISGVGYIAEDEELPGKIPGVDWVVNPIELPGVDDDVEMESPPNIEIMHDLESP